MGPKPADEAGYPPVWRRSGGTRRNLLGRGWPRCGRVWDRRSAVPILFIVRHNAPLSVPVILFSGLAAQVLVWGLPFMIRSDFLLSGGEDPNGSRPARSLDVARADIFVG